MAICSGQHKNAKPMIGPVGCVGGGAAWATGDGKPCVSLAAPSLWPEFMSAGQCVYRSSRRPVRATRPLKITIGDFFLEHVTFGCEIFAGTTPHSGDAATGPACLGCLRCGFVTVTTQVSPEKSARLGCYFDLPARLAPVVNRTVEGGDNFRQGAQHAQASIPD